MVDLLEIIGNLKKMIKFEEKMKFETRFDPIFVAKSQFPGGDLKIETFWDST